MAIAEFERTLTELNALKADRARERAAHTVDEAIRAGKIVPAQREWAIAYCAADARGFQAFAAKQPSIVGENLGLGGPADRPTAAAARSTRRSSQSARSSASSIPSLSAASADAPTS